MRSWLRSFSNLDRSRSIRAKRFAFMIKPDLLRRIWEKSDLATPISAAHHDQKDPRVLFHRTGLISSDKSRLIWIDLDLEKDAAHDYRMDRWQHQFLSSINICCILLFMNICCSWVRSVATWTMFADQYTNYGMNFGSDKVSDSIVDIRLGQCLVLLLSPNILQCFYDVCCTSILHCIA